MSDLSRLRVQVFGDAADVAAIKQLRADPLIAGFTTNPTLMRAAGVTNYATFGRDATLAAGGRPISFEVISDDVATMIAEAREIASWGPSVFVKVPITDTSGRSTAEVIERLAAEGVRINVTAVFTLQQVANVAPLVARAPAAFVSIFAGRIADTGREPIPVVMSAVEILRAFPTVRLIWASSREVLNVFHADAAGCHVITLTADLVKKLSLVGKDLDEYSLETVCMFNDDARRSGLTLPVREVGAAH